MASAPEGSWSPCAPLDCVEERTLDDEGAWRQEAQAVIRDVERGVQYIGISDKLESCNSCIYLNLTTKEGNRRTLKLSATGFQIVGLEHDKDEEGEEEETFETPYSLLNRISPAFTLSFGGDLASKLSQLSRSHSNRELSPD